MGRNNENLFQTDVDLFSLKVYLKEIAHKPILKKEEEVELILKAQAGDLESRNRIIEQNLKLVVSIAKGYIGRGMFIEDIIAEGNFGLIKAIEKFDTSKGFRFSTYATFWIRQVIERSIGNKSKLIRIPVHMSESISKYNKHYEKLKIKLNREPTIEELAEVMNVTVKKAGKIVNSIIVGVSIDTIPNDESKSLDGILLVEENDKMPEEVLMQNKLKTVLYKCLNLLPTLEQNVLSLKYNLETDDKYSIAEIASQLDITKDKVKSLEKSGMRKIKKHLENDEINMDSLI